MGKLEQIPERLIDAAHELFPMAQCAPWEGISDAADRIAQFLNEFAAAERETQKERDARIAESYQRDASFDDSIVGAQEHNANQANIAAAIRSRKDEG